MSKRKLAFPKELFNDKFYNYVFNVWGRDVTLLLGSAGSSKSVHEALKTVYRVFFKNHNVLVVRKRYNSLKDSFYTELKKAIHTLKLSGYFKFTVAPLSIQCTNGRVILFRGLDDVEKIKSIVPENGIINHIVCEEATEIDEDDLNQLQFRSRGGGDRLDTDEISKLRKGIATATTEQHMRDIRAVFLDAVHVSDSGNIADKSITLMFNTISEDHWIPQRFIFKKGRPIFELPVSEDQPSIYDTKELYIMHSTHWDNQFLTIDDHMRYESYKFIDQYYYDVYARGLWGILGDTIFTKFKLARFDDQFIQNVPIIRVGQDFGHTDPTTLVRVGINKAKREIYIIDEAGESGLDTAGIVAQCSAFLYRDEIVRCDSADPITIRDLQTYGIKAIGVKKPPNYKIQFVRMLKMYTIYISEKCPNFLREIRSYTWPVDKNGKRIEEVPDGNDHYIDAGLFYALNDDLMNDLPSKIYG